MWVCFNCIKQHYKSFDAFFVILDDIGIKCRFWHVSKSWPFEKKAVSIYLCQAN
jgi:hypothetical protein